MRKRNVYKTVKVSMRLSTEACQMLDQLVVKGIYGSTRSEVAARFVDQRLECFFLLKKETRS